MDRGLCVVQPYLPQARGVDSPTLVITDNTAADGLFPGVHLDVGAEQTRMTLDTRTLLPIADHAVTIAAEIIRTKAPGVITAKGDRDMATEMDYAVENAVREFLARETPEIGFLGEEEGVSRTGKASCGHSTPWTAPRTSYTASRCAVSPWVSWTRTCRASA